MKLLAYSLGVSLVTLLTFLPSVRYEFVGIDDHEYVYENPHVLSGLSRENVRWAVTSCGYACNWHPLTWLSLQADASLLKQKPAAPSDDGLDASFKPLASVMHAHNVLLHAASAALLFLLITIILRRIDPEKGGSLPIAALFALIWSIHPLRTEVVCWISERKEALSVFFMLLSMIAYVGGQGQRSRSTVEFSNSTVHLRRSFASLRLFRPSVSIAPPTFSLLYLLSLVFFALALLAKPVAVTLPVVLFAWDWVMTGRSFGRSLVASVPFLLLAAGASAMTLASQVVPIGVGMGFSVVEKIVMSVSAPAIYLRQALWPFGLSVNYPLRPPVPWVELFVGAALFCGAVAVCVAWLRRRRSAVLSLLAFAVAWCLVSLVPMLGIVKVGDQPHSDRYTYWVGCGVAALAAVAVIRYVRRREDEKVKALAGIVVVLAAITWMRMPVWHDSLRLFSDAVPKSWCDKPVCTLSQILWNQGPEGKRQADLLLREAVTRTHTPGVTAEFAYLLACRAEKSELFLGDSDPAFAEARLEANSVLADEPDHPVAHEALAIIDMREGKFEDALKRLEWVRATCHRDLIRRVDREIAFCRKRVDAPAKESNVQK